MNAKITTFLNSDLLEKYLVGQTTSDESEMVETYISKYPEVQNAYNTLQFNLEVVAKSNAVEPPKHILNNILEELDDSPPVVNIHSQKNRKIWYKLSIAASFATLFFAVSSVIFYTQNQKLSEENQVVVDEIFDLRSDIAKNNEMLDSVMRQLLKLNNPETEKYIINGNERAKDLKTIAYINPKEKTSMIDVVSLPQLPEEQCYQIWAELQGKMVSLGVLSEADRKLKTIPYTEHAKGLNITIEPKGGNTIASLQNSVAEINLQ
ncbi:RNA polymerase subunit sigma-70 [Pseudalgibacter alginicilyticus]|uniref:RNA polymerase subunit sigma-70 n=1 Tax=Pseudalgibacter alginicilyticus TaxID=1736674 RepID=A0A0N7HYV6_9FLAO|nr:anti-sigma factor [Pseudalgibacter alginicilyticus]ALJ06318.1 RNA polymerase subunit sigma-70 [Pseudalgibacter alginicilyticus]